MNDEDLRTLYFLLSEVPLSGFQDLVRDSSLDPKKVRQALEALSATQPNEAPLLNWDDSLV